MKYDEKKFNEAVRYYRKQLGNIKNKVIMVTMPLDNDGAYYSVAPLSRAIHEEKGDIHVFGIGDESPSLESLLKTWQIYHDYKKKKKTAAVEAMIGFIRAAEKKLGKGKFEKIFRAPDLILRARPDGFKGNINLEYRQGWFRPYKWKTLMKTAKIVWEQVYALKKTERVGIGFETISAKKDQKMPLEDYLDSYLISRAMMFQAEKIGKSISFGASTPRSSMLVPMDRIADLKATLMGCELSKDINEAVFKRFKEFSRYIGTSKIKHNSATFFIAGKGYPGKHAFGQLIGYPTPNRKSRWSSGAGILYQLDYYPQTKHDSRQPKARVGFTDTIPLDIFIKTCNIDWMEMKRKDDVLREIAKRSIKFVVKSNIKAKYKTDFEVGLVMENGKKRTARGSDVETRSIINRRFYKKTGIKAGTMANIPGGEMFVTPEYLEGTVVGDVVISIDRSYGLSSRNPFIIKSTKKGYKVAKGPKQVVDAFTKKKKESMKILKEQEKAKALPKKLIELKKKNFNRIGEFAINTNPKAELCDYLIVNEKIANMIHVAMGSGFEADRATEYHSDVVIDAPGQKLDIYAVDEKGEKTWIMKKGVAVYNK